jgi:hypothetical protein
MVVQNYLNKRDVLRERRVPVFQYVFIGKPDVFRLVGWSPFNEKKKQNGEKEGMVIRSSVRKHNVACSTSAARLSHISSREKLV